LSRYQPTRQVSLQNFDARLFGLNVVLHRKQSLLSTMLLNPYPYQVTPCDHPNPSIII
jgi:hypothetical protein